MTDFEKDFSATMQGERFPVGAYFYPFTMTCEESAARAAQAGFSVQDETELVKRALPMFPGHDQPRAYCLGDPTVTNWDNADPAAMGVQVELMKDAGLEFVIFDTYGGLREGRKVREYEAPIQTFLQGDKGGLQFAIMWSLDAPRVSIPVPNGIDLENEPGRAYDITAETARFIVDECVEKYWLDPGYFCIKGRPYLSLYNTATFMDAEGTVFRDFVEIIKEYACSQYGYHPYVVGVTRGTTQANEIMDGATGYALLPNFRGKDIQTFDEQAADCHVRWEFLSAANGIPFIPPAGLGWDASPRCEPGRRIEDVSGKYPHTPIVIDATPEKAAALLRDALTWTTENVPPAERYGLICAWNEITEGTTMLPRVIDGEADFSYLNAIATVLRNPA
jgi:hypothetical protein